MVIITDAEETSDKIESILDSTKAQKNRNSQKVP
jgi:hypothetical protein